MIRNHDAAVDVWRAGTILYLFFIATVMNIMLDTSWYLEHFTLLQERVYGNYNFENHAKIILDKLC